MECSATSSICYENIRPGHARFAENTASLAGPWRMLSLRAEDTPPEGITDADFPDRKWEKVTLPSELPVREYRQDGPSVGLISHTRKDPAPTAIVGAFAYFRRSFRLCAEWLGRPVILRCDGVGAGMELWVNGTFVGRSTSSLLPVEFDITPYLCEDKNCICIRVSRTAASDELLLPHQWVQRGIFGEIALYSLPVQRIEDVAVQAEFRSDGTPQALHVALATHNAEGLLARIAVMKDNQVVAHTDARIGEDLLNVRIPCPDVVLWTPEFPTLYRLAVILSDRSGICHTRELPFGFRRISLSCSGLKLNGIPIKLYGVNYRRCSPSEELMVRDLETMRQSHINAVFVQSALPERFYELCDQRGILVIDSSCLRDPQPPLREAARQIEEHLIFSRRHHPSILAWDVHQSRQTVSQWDPTRPILSDFYAIRDVEEVRLQQFLNHEDIQEKPVGLRRLLSGGTSIAKESYQDLPLLVTSFGEVLGNGTPPAAAFVRMMRRSDQLCGIFLWNFADQSLDGEWLDGCLTGLVREDGTPHALLTQIRSDFQCIRFTRQNRNLTVHNHSLFHNLRDYTVVCDLTRDGQAIESCRSQLSARPGDAATFPLRLHNQMFQFGHYALQLRASLDGEATASICWPLCVVPQVRDDNPGGSIRDEDGNVTLRAETVAYVISRSTGNLEQMTVHDEPLLLSPLEPQFCRPKTAFDQTMKQNEEWEKLTLRRKLPKPSVFEVDHMTRSVTVSQSVGSGLMRTYRLFASGALEIELRLRTGKTAPSRIGLGVCLPRAFSHCSWLGLGPDDGYPDRMDGLRFSRFETACGESADLYPIVQEYGCKQQVRELALSREDGTGLRISCRDGLCAAVRQWDLDTLCATEERAALPESDRTALSLDVIQNGLGSEVILPHTTYTFRFLLEPLV